MRKCLVLAIIILQIVTYGSGASAAEDNIDLKAAIAANDVTKLNPLSQEHQEVVFFNNLCVENNSDEAKILAYLKPFISAGLVTPLSPQQIAQIPPPQPDDNIIHAWILSDPLTHSTKQVSITKYGTCQMVVSNTLANDAMSQEFKGLVYATTVSLQGNLHGGLIGSPKDTGVYTESYLITAPGKPLAMQLALARTEPANGRFMLTYGRIETPAKFK